MGLSFSGLSLVTTAGLELGANTDVHEGVGGELPGRAATLSAGSPATNRKGGSSEFESDREAAVYTGVDVQLPQGRELPPQASPFSAVWASAVGPADPEASGPRSDSPSILGSEESLVSGGASQQRLADLLATTRGEAATVGTPNLLGTLAQRIGSAPVSDTTAGIDSGENSAVTSSGSEPSAKLVDTNLLQEALRSHAGQPGDAALTGSALGANEDTVAAFNAKDDRVPGTSAAPADHADQTQAAHIDETSAAAFQDAVRNLANTEREFGRDRKVSRAQSEKPSAENAGSGLNQPAASQQTASANPANLYAPTASTANTPTPEAPPVAAQNGEARPNRTTALPQHADRGIEMPAVVTGEAQTRHRSEVAFEAELRLQNKSGSADTAIPNNQSGSASRTSTVLEANPARPEANQRPTLESKVSLEELESAQREAFRRSAVLSGRGELSGGQNQASGNLDRGTQQPTLSPQGPAVSQPLSPVTALPKQAAVPAAAQLDALAVETPVETSSPAQSIAFKVQSEGRGAANVILTDRGGQVHMTVRSSDTALTQSLRGDLGSLAGSFQQQGFDVKLWNPSSGSSTGDDSRGNSFDFGQDMHGHTRQRHSSNDPRRQGHGAEWPEEID